MSATSPNTPRVDVSKNEIIGKIQQALAQSPDVNIQNLVIDAADNKVRLIGIVDTLRERQLAGRIASRVLGSSRVINNLSISVDKPLLDQEIRERIEEALADYPTSSPAAVGVRAVEDGVVYLTGSVPTLEEAQGAIDIVAGIKGVGKVVSEIRIAAGEPVDDISLTNTVMDALSDDPRIDPFDIHVQAQNGHVYIHGEVRDAEARMAATELARSAPGVHRVTNLLQVREED